MRLKGIFFTFFVSLAYGLTCEEDIRCCRIIKAQKLFQKLDIVKQLPENSQYCTASFSHHAIMLTLENRKIRFIELPTAKTSLKCTINRNEKGEGHTPLDDEVKITNGMMLGRLQVYGEQFLLGKEYWCGAHSGLGPKKEFPAFVYGVPITIRPTVNCITLVNHLWEKLLEQRFLNTDDVELGECSSRDDDEDLLSD